MWTIDKQFSFCYGHRVWSQKLEHEYCESNDTSCKCRHLHGHEGLVHVFLEGETLDRGMVTDFKHLGWLKNFLDDTLDHKFIIDVNDPFFTGVTNATVTGKLDPVTMKRTSNDEIMLPRAFNTSRRLPLTPVKVPGTEHVTGYTIDTSVSCSVGVDELFLDGPEKEFYDGFFLVEFVPTSENFCKWLYDLVDAKMSKLGIDVARIDWFETPKSRSSYSKPRNSGCCCQ